MSDYDISFGPHNTGQWEDSSAPHGMGGIDRPGGFTDAEYSIFKDFFGAVEEDYKYWGDWSEGKCGDAGNCQEKTESYYTSISAGDCSAGDVSTTTDGCTGPTSTRTIRRYQHEGTRERAPMLWESGQEGSLYDFEESVGSGYNLLKSSMFNMDSNEKLNFVKTLGHDGYNNESIQGLLNEYGWDYGDVDPTDTRSLRGVVADKLIEKFNITDPKELYDKLNKYNINIPKLDANILNSLLSSSHQDRTDHEKLVKQHSFLKGLNKVSSRNNLFASGINKLEKDIMEAQYLQQIDDILYSQSGSKVQAANQLQDWMANVDEILDSIHEEEINE